MDILDVNGNHIRALREELRWSREKLSEESGVPTGTIQDIETGASKNPGLETIKKLLSNLPNYVHINNSRESLIIGIHGRLPTLNNDELRTISKAIDDFLSMPGRLDSRTTRTK